MILADTSVVIAYERSPTPRLRKLIQDHAATICGITLAELFAGVRTRADETRCMAAIAEFERLAIPETLWESVGRYHAESRSKGITVQLADSTIAALAIISDIELWTYDAHFTLIQGLLPQLRLFEEPP